MEGAAVIAFQSKLAMTLCLLLSCLEPSLPTAADERDVDEQPILLLVTGAPGADEYAQEFSVWEERWIRLATEGGWQLVNVKPEDERSQKDVLLEALSEQANAANVWIVFLGHGTASRGDVKFNLIGEDVSAKELKHKLDELSGSIVVINCSSASAPFLVELGARERVVVTATRGAGEINFSRFGGFLSKAVTNMEADIDHDREVSLLEAFLWASAQTERFYLDDARLATEHALLDDNGDRVGTSGDFYRGIRPSKRSKSGKEIDGKRSARLILFSSPDAIVLTVEQRVKRAELETRIDELRGRKEQMQEQDYLAQLEVIMLDMAAVYKEAEQANR